MPGAASLPAVLKQSSPTPAERRGQHALEFTAAILIAGIWIGYVFWQSAVRKVAADFAPFYCAGKILRGEGAHALYDWAVIREQQMRLFPERRTTLPFIRPPFYALALSPFSLLSPGRALLVWLSLNILALVAALFLSARAMNMEFSALSWHTAIFFPALYAVFNRQDVPLVLLLAAAAYLLLARDRPFSAGLALSLCEIKFNLLLVVPLCFLIRKNWRALAGFAAGSSVLLLISTFLVGPAGMIEYARMLIQRTPPQMEFPQRTANVASLVANTWVQVLLMLFVAAAVITAARRLPQLEAVSAAWLGSLLIVPHVFISDYLLALPALLLLARLNPACLFSSLVVLFPVTPIFMVRGDRFLLLTPLMVLVCLAGSAFLPAKSWKTAAQ
jgi:hypothetical protein